MLRCITRADLIGIAEALKSFPQLKDKNVAVFDTAFHQTMPEEYSVRSAVQPAQRTRRSSLRRTRLPPLSTLTQEAAELSLEQTG
ncbi:hypothetical protein ACLK2H_13160 [Escherichia coli]